MGKNVKNFIYKDKNLFAMLARTNIATEQQVNIFMGTRRAEGHVKDGLLEKVTLIIKSRGEQKTLEMYRLTEQGKNVAKERCNISSMYASTSPRHDLALTQAYIELFQKNPLYIDRWITENDYKIMLQEKVLELREDGRSREAELMEENIISKRYSVPDGGYMDEQGQIHAIEVVTRHYKEKTIIAKANTIQVLGISSCTEIYIA